jgi:hypothetical protein
VRRRGRSSTVTRSRSRPRNRLRRDVRGYGCVLCCLAIILRSAYEHSEVPDDHDWRRFQCFIDNCVVDNCGALFRRHGFGPNPSEAAVFVGFGFGFPIWYPFHRRLTPPRPLIPASGTPSQRSGVTLPLHLPRARRSPIHRGAAGQTRRVSICWETGPLDPRGNRATERYGTACRDASGQWRVVN